MNVKELSDRFKLKANQDTAIHTYVFDDLASINVDRNKGYPLILMKVPSSVATPFQTNDNMGQWENYTVTFYAFMRWTKEDKKTKPLEVAYAEIEAIGDNYLRNVLVAGEATSTKDVEYGLITDKQVSKARGHHLHVVQLIGCQYTFTLRVFNATCS